MICLRRVNETRGPACDATREARVERLQRERDTQTILRASRVRRGAQLGGVGVCHRARIAPTRAATCVR